MTKTRLIPTKALSAFLRSRHTSLSAAVARCGLDQDRINGETVDDDTVGRIARLHGLTPEELAEKAASFA